MCRPPKSRPVAVMWFFPPENVWLWPAGETCPSLMGVSNIWLTENPVQVMKNHLGLFKNQLMNYGEQSPFQMETCPLLISVFQVTQTKLQYLYNFISQAKCYRLCSVKFKPRESWLQGFYMTFFKIILMFLQGFYPYLNVCVCVLCGDNSP